MQVPCLPWGRSPQGLPPPVPFCLDVELTLHPEWDMVAFVKKAVCFLVGLAFHVLIKKKKMKQPLVSYALLMDVEDLKDSMEMMLRWDFLTSEGLKDQLEPSLCLS